ncbi:MAG: YgjV family protein [Clostridia bacterium]|nr:YgjV family protein [Clostridia bacterium]
MAVIIGQILGLIALAFTALSYQMNDNKKLLVMQTISTAMFCVHYYLIGAAPGLTLNILCILRNLIYYNRDKKIFSGWFFPVLISLAQGVVGAFSWQGWYSVLIIAGLMINTLFLAQPSAQTIRKSILLTSSLILIYDIFVLSIGGIINEALAITSSIIGILRMRKKELK